MAAVDPRRVSGVASSWGSAPAPPQLTEGLHDVPFVAPLARMRRTVTQVRALLRGERIPLAVTDRGPAAQAQPARRPPRCRSSWPRSPTSPSGSPASWPTAGCRSCTRAGCLAAGARRSCARAPRAPAARERRVADLSVGADGGGRRSGGGARRGRVVRVVLPHDDGAALSPVARASGIRARSRGGDRRQQRRASRARCRRRPRSCWRS